MHILMFILIWQINLSYFTVAAFLIIRISLISPPLFFSFLPPYCIGCTGKESNTKVKSKSTVTCLRIFASFKENKTLWAVEE